MQPDFSQKIKLRMKMLEEVKKDYESMLYDIARFVNPRRELLKDSQRFDNKGHARGKDAYSGVPDSALSVWVDGMQGHMVSQSLKWFKTIISKKDINEIDEVQRYLQDYDEAMYSEFNRSNFYAILSEWFRDAGSVGTATLYTEEDMGRQLPTHTVIHPREIFISENRYGEVDTVYRKFFLTARQAVQMFPKNLLGRNIVKNAEDHPEKKHEFIHAVEPNGSPMFGSLLAEDKPFSSIYLEQDSDNLESGGIVRRSGYDYNPYAVWRLRKNSDEIYGYSPAADAMVSIKSINQMSKTLMKAAHVAIASPLNVPEHMRGNVRIEPDGLNYYDNPKNIITPVRTSMNYPIGLDREEKIQRIIEDKYRVEFFLILARAEREMTATEIMERQAEKAVLLGPQVDRLSNEGLTKVFDIVARIAEQNRRLPEPPPVLQDAVEEAKTIGRQLDISVKFIGPLAQAQRRLFQMQPIKNGLNELAMASAVFPKVLDRVDPDKLAERILDVTDFPQDIMRTDDELGAIRERQEAELAEQKAMQLAQGAADAYPKLSKKSEEGSPAEQLMGAM